MRSAQRHRVRPGYLLAAVVGTVLAACTSDADPGRSPASGSRSGLASTASAAPGARATVAGWHEFALPRRDARIRVMVPLDSGLLALGSVRGRAIQGSSDRAPGAWFTRDLRTWRAVPVRPVSGYGELAEFIRGGSSGGRIRAFGHATGGAHGNPRPTIWTGSAAGLREQLQSFTMFGGLAAISQTGEAVGPGGALIVGQWEGRTGYGAAVWTSADGAEWVRHQDVPGLAPGRNEQTTARGVAARPRDFLVVGDLQPAFGPTRALAWTPSVPADAGRAWRRISLAPPGGGAGATAARASCRGSSCVIIGSRVSGAPRLLCWTLGADGRSRLGRPGPSAALVKPHQVLDTGRDLYAVVGTDRAAVLARVTRDCSAWHTVALPMRSNDAAIGQLGRRLVLATNASTGSGAPSRLWVRTA